MVRVVTDSCSDLTPELAQRFGIVIVPLYVNFGNETYRDNVDLSTEEFYHRLAQSKTIPTTSAPSPEVLAELFYRSKVSPVVGAHVGPHVLAVSILEGE